MSNTNSKSSAGIGAMLIRVLVLINFVLMLVLIGPGRSHNLDLALRRAGIASALTLALQIWFVGATLLATALFVWGLLRKSDVTEAKTLRPKRLDWILVLTWWATVVILCLYAFMIGMGG
jgi:hypothetical protein